jgi:hypothetical protein
MEDKSQICGEICGFIIILGFLALPIYVFIISINAIEDPNKFKAHHLNFRIGNITEKYIVSSSDDNGYSWYFASVVFKYNDGECYYDFCTQCSTIVQAERSFSSYIIGHTYDIWISDWGHNSCQLKNGYKDNSYNETLKFFIYLYICLFLLFSCTCIFISIFAIYLWFYPLKKINEGNINEEIREGNINEEMREENVNEEMREGNINEEMREEVISPIHTNIIDIQPPRKIYDYIPINFIQDTIESPMHEVIIDIESLKHTLTVMPIPKNK